MQKLWEWGEEVELVAALAGSFKHKAKDWEKGKHSDRKPKMENMKMQKSYRKIWKAEYQVGRYSSTQRKADGQCCCSAKDPRNSKKNKEVPLFGERHKQVYPQTKQ